MITLDTILNAEPRQLSIDDLLAEIEQEESPPGAWITATKWDDSPQVMTGRGQQGAAISPEIGPEPHRAIPSVVNDGPESHLGTKSLPGQAEFHHSARNDGFPSGWMWQLSEADIKRAFVDVLADVVDRYQQKFGNKPKTVWANPVTGDGDRVTHDKRIGRGYLLLGPLPKSMEV